MRAGRASPAAGGGSVPRRLWRRRARLSSPPTGAQERSRRFKSSGCRGASPKGRNSLTAAAARAAGGRSQEAIFPLAQSTTCCRTGGGLCRVVGRRVGSADGRPAGTRASRSVLRNFLRSVARSWLYSRPESWKPHFQLGGMHVHVDHFRRHVRARERRSGNAPSSAARGRPRPRRAAASGRGCGGR